MKILLGGNVHADLRKLVVSRLLIQANSGGGKSWALRRLLEQTHGHVQQIVIDPEDEFYTLREKYDYILVRHEDGDCVPEIRSADLLATRLLELGVSAIISLYELHPRDRREFVKRFLNSLVNAPKKLWHRALIVVDEAHEFCPEQGKQQKGDVVADAVIGLMSKGRKRGFCGVLATQRLSKLNKDAAAEAKNKLIGNAVLDLDRKRAAEELGFSSKEQTLSLRNLESGEFYGFGPAISREAVKFRFGVVETTHPEAGSSPAPVAAPKSKVQSVLAKLADLPQEAEQERVTIADLQKKIREYEQQRRDLVDAARRAAAEARVETETKTVYALKDSQITRLEAAIEKTRTAEKIVRDAANMVEQRTGEISKAIAPVLEALQTITRSGPSLRAPGSKLMDGTHPSPGVVPRSAPRISQRTGSIPAGDTQGGGPSGGLRRILIALANRPNGLTTRQIGVRAGLSSKGGTFSTYLSRARTSGWIEGDKSGVRITQAGIDALGSFELLPGGEQLYQYWLGQLGESGAARILRALYEAHPNALTKEEVGERAQISTAGGSFSTYLSRLRSLELITGNKELKASDELFE
jgi:ribosomal protein S7